MEIKRQNIPEGPITIYLTFRDVQTKPFYIAVKEPGKGKPYLYRHEINKDSAEIRLPKHPGEILLITGEGKFDQIITGRLKYPRIPWKIPFEVSRPYSIDELKIRPNANMDTPARIFVDRPLIEYNPVKMAQYDKPTQRFIIQHELAHYHYDNEIMADAYATVNFLNEGNNPSSAVYALTKVLGRSLDNLKRMMVNYNLVTYLDSNAYDG